ncbi:MAG: DNA repair protein RecO [Candidatus Pelagibacter bacterium]|jgi:DNA repair protein RecO (recombination protein O)|nr:DNA repair protein RecO [Candidatus Pelagibacter bacterium]|tara:strand:- start:300 stop:980 length:681 start_codon:yes stop_codon:yes gene_type:complete
MQFEDKGYLLSKHNYNENSVISEIFTINHGKISGIIFGATSKKLKNYLQIGNKFHINFNSKTDDRVGYFKVELEEALAPIYFDNKKKLACLISAMNLIKLLTVESQENIKIFKLIDNFFYLLKNQNWLKQFILWELQFLKVIGYDLELKNLVDQELVNGEKIYFVKLNNEKKLIPNFLIDIDEHVQDNKILLKGLKLVGDYIDKSILKPNNISFPNSRINFVNLIK